MYLSVEDTYVRYIKSNITGSPYNAVTTREQYLFYEVRTTAFKAYGVIKRECSTKTELWIEK